MLEKNIKKEFVIISLLRLKTVNFCILILDVLSDAVLRTSQVEVDEPIIRLV